MTDRLEAADRSEAKLANEPIDSTDAADPTLPMLSTEPTDPIDRKELVDPILSIEFRDATLQRDVLMPDDGVMPASCHRQASDAVWACHDVRTMDATREQLFDLYDTTIVSALDPDHGWTDPALVAIARGRSALVMTAWNPGHQRPSESDNRRANDVMRQELAATGREVWRADGRAPGGAFSEEGWLAWGLPVDVGLAIAARYGQFAIYAYDETGLRVTVACPQ